MKCLFATILATTALLVPYPRAVAFHGGADLNVNSRYRIEKVSIQSAAVRLSRTIERELGRMAGEVFRPELLDKVESQIRAECPGYEVKRLVSKGERPNSLHVRYVLERAAKMVDWNSPRFLYHSRQQFSFGAGADLRLGESLLSLGLLTDNDERAERASGFRGTALVPVAGGGRVKASLLAESFRATWVSQNDDFYRARTRLEPALKVQLTPSLEWTSGFSFNSMDFQVPAARAQNAHALFTSLRYKKQGHFGLAGTQTLEAGYDLRAAATTLGSDFRYRRHLAEVEYTLASGALQRPKNSLTLRATAGSLSGQAPILDRFVLGNSRTLRGFNRFDLTPLGANRMAHVSLDGRHHFLRMIYDTGTVWIPGRPTLLRHSVGLVVVFGCMTAMIAMPVRSGPVEPIFLLGMNF